MGFVATPYVPPLNPSRGALRMAAIVRAVVRVPGLRAFLLLPAVARSGYWFATSAAFLWGGILFGRFGTREQLHFYDYLPRWAFGRGGTTIGAIYLTRDNEDDGVLQHERVHTEQWRRYGLCFIPLYIAAGTTALGNRFEVEAGLARGHYL
ncbi:MAG: hypothetical protein M3N46_05425 [Actinomycetota bacterium]|nr:hypothetical protein [Actinomycetota bacterium]